MIDKPTALPLAYVCGVKMGTGIHYCVNDNSSLRVFLRVWRMVKDPNIVSCSVTCDMYLKECGCKVWLSKGIEPFDWLSA